MLLPYQLGNQQPLMYHFTYNLYFALHLIWYPRQHAMVDIKHPNEVWKGASFYILLQGCSSLGFLPPLTCLMIVPQEIQINIYHQMRPYFTLIDFLSQSESFHRINFHNSGPSLFRQYQHMHQHTVNHVYTNNNMLKS